MIRYNWLLHKLSKRHAAADVYNDNNRRDNVSAADVIRVYIIWLCIIKRFRYVRIRTNSARLYIDRPPPLGYYDEQLA